MDDTYYIWSRYAEGGPTSAETIDAKGPEDAVKRHAAKVYALLGHVGQSPHIVTCHPFEHIWTFEVAIDFTMKVKLV